MNTSLVRHLLRPARGGALMVIIVFSLLLCVCSYAGLFGLPLEFIITSWFFKYAYILFDAASRGFDEPPTLDIQMVNPVNEQRPLGQVIILSVIYGVYLLAEVYVSPSFAISLLLLSLFLLPASVAVLGVESNLLKAIYPAMLFRMVQGLGLQYGVILGAIFSYTVLAALLAHLHVWRLFDTTFGMFAVLSLFSLLGGLIYERRDELGFEAWHSPERTAAKVHAEASKRDVHFVAEVYGRIRANHHVEAWEMLVGWLASRSNTLEDYRWLMSRVILWDDTRYATRLTQEFLERLLALKQTGEALRVAVQRLALDPKFRPRTAIATLTLAQLGADGGGSRTLARTFADDFATRFPNDPGCGAASTLRARLQL